MAVCYSGLLSWDAPLMMLRLSESDHRHLPHTLPNLVDKTSGTGLQAVFLRVLFEFADAILAAEIDGLAIMLDGQFFLIIHLFSGYRTNGIAGNFLPTDLLMMGHGLVPRILMPLFVIVVCSQAGGGKKAPGTDNPRHQQNHYLLFKHS
jgi:hypothetical protein